MQVLPTAAFRVESGRFSWRRSSWRLRMTKFKLGPGQGLAIDQWEVLAMTRGCRLVPLRVPAEIRVIRGHAGQTGRHYTLQPRQSLRLPCGGVLLSDSRREIEIAIHGPAGETLDLERSLRHQQPAVVPAAAQDARRESRKLPPAHVSQGDPDGEAV